MAITKKSGLQKEVLALYRRALRLIPSKPSHAQPSFRAYIRYTFNHNAHAISPRDFTAIEHQLRVGRRHIEQLEDSAVRSCFASKDMLDWVAQNPGRHYS